MALAALAAWLLCACDREVHSVRTEFELRHPDGCELGAVAAVTLRATGDFSPWEQAVALDGGSVALGGAPHDSRVLVFDGDYAGGRAGGLRTLDGEDQQGRVLMLPVGRSCPLSEASATIDPGAAVVALGDGSLIAFGGNGPDGAHAKVLIRRPGELDLEPVEAILPVPRAWASATRVGSRVVVAGGGPGGDLRLTYDSFEIFDLESETFVARGTLSLGKRRSHSAVALASGEVLIVGGVGDGSSAPLSSAELVDPQSAEAYPVEDELGLGRSAPGLWQLRSGIILVVGGTDARGIAVPAAEWLDLERMRFMPTGAELTAHPAAVAARLPGDRVAWFGCDVQLDTCELDLLLANFDVESVPLDRNGLGGVALGQLRMQGLDSGALQIFGTEADGSYTAVELDLNTGVVRPVPTGTPMRELWPLGDGSSLHHGVEGTFVMRNSLLSPYGAPGDALLAPDSFGVTLDGRSRWAVSALGLSARAPQARFDLPTLVFGAVQITVELGGNVELLLTPEGTRAVSVSFEQTRIAVGDCNLSRAIGEPVQLRREGRSLTLESAGKTERCTIDALRGPVGLALRAGPGATVTRFDVIRP